jgi:hypothetical protein
VGIDLRGTTSTTLRHAQAWARQRRGSRLAEVDRYLTELWRLAQCAGYDPALLAAQSSEATDGWTSDLWHARLNPANLGSTDVGDPGLWFEDGINAARAHVVHASAHADGWEPRFAEFLKLDPSWQRVFEGGYAGSARTLEDLVGCWTPNPRSIRSVRTHLDGMRGAIRRPGATPQPAPGGAPLPERISYEETGNWSVRSFEQRPLAILIMECIAPCMLSLISWYQNPASRESLHALVDRDGVIHQLVSSRHAGWTVEVVKNPRKDIPWLNRAVAETRAGDSPLSLNDYVLSIGYVTTSPGPPSEQQYRAMIALGGYWRDRYGIAVDRGHLIRLGDVNSVDSRDNPSPGFDLDRIILSLGGDPMILT